MTATVASTTLRIAKAAAQKAADKMFAVGTHPGSAQTFRGQRLNARTIQMLLNAENILGSRFHITQGSYSTRVAASGSTHAGGGAMDTDSAGKGWYSAQVALRRAGFAAWVRTPSQGPWGQHIHSIATGDASASPAAKRQVQDYYRGGDGLGGGMAKGGKVLSFDSGGMLPTGPSFVYNGTGRPEPVGHDFIRMQDLEGMRIALDAPGIGTLTGHIRMTATHVARDEIGASSEFASRTGRMHG